MHTTKHTQEPIADRVPPDKITCPQQYHADELCRRQKRRNVQFKFAHMNLVGTPRVSVPINTITVLVNIHITRGQTHTVETKALHGQASRCKDRESDSFFVCV